MANYYFINKLWIDANTIAIIPVFISCVFRFFNQNINKNLLTDHLTRICLIFMWIYYFFDMYYKYPVDGSDSICEKAFYIHHIASLVIVPPLFLNRYIPWWVCPIGFMHGFCIKFPEY